MPFFHYQTKVKTGASAPVPNDFNDLVEGDNTKPIQ
jgi:hypothetical protein